MKTILSSEQTKNEERTCCSQIWALLLACVCCFPGLVRGQEAKDCFVKMPDSIQPLLTAVNRADFVDFMDSKMKAEVTNRFNGKSEMTALTPDYICIRTSEASTWQMKLLAVNDSTRVICTVSTASGPAGDSHIRFYTSSWQPLEAGAYLPALPVSDDFIAPDTAGTSAVYREARHRADLLLMRADLSPSDATLTFTYTTPDYMEKETADKLKPFVRRPLVYRWEEGKFVR